MGWVLAFVLSWILFLICVDWKRLWPNVIGDIWASIIQIMVDKIFIGLNLYAIKESILCISGAGSIFFTLGPVFTMGTLMVQHLPENRWARLLNIFIWVAFFMLFEHVMWVFGYLEYRHWNSLYSFWIDIMALIDISWLGENLVKRMR